MLVRGGKWRGVEGGGAGCEKERGCLRFTYACGVKVVLSILICCSETAGVSSSVYGGEWGNVLGN